MLLSFVEKQINILNYQTSNERFVTRYKRTETLFHLTPPWRWNSLDTSELVGFGHYRILLPLKDLFRNREIEINIDLSELKNLFKVLELPQIIPATVV